MNIIPPSDQNLEQLVLGTIINSINAANLLLAELQDTDFYYGENKTIFLACKQLYIEGTTIDTYLLSTTLKNKNQLEGIGGIQRIINIAQNYSVGCPYSEYADSLKNLSNLRKILYICREGIEKSCDKNSKSQEIINEIQDKLFDLQGLKNKSATPLKEVYEDFRDDKSFEEHLDDIIERKSKGLPTYDGVLTGYPKLDETIGGFKKGTITYVGARTSMGKTTFLLNLMLAIKSKNPEFSIGFFSLEMPRSVIAAKFACLKSDVNYSKYEDAYLSDEQFDRLRYSVKDMIDNPVSIYIEDPDRISASTLRSRAKRMLQNFDIKILFVDYLTRITGNNKHNSKHLEVDEVSKSLQSLAKELQIPIVCLCQLNRALLLRKDPMPTLADFRESGSVEEDADVAILLHRPSYYDENNEPGIIQAIIAKNRIRGKLCKVKFSCEYAKSERYYELTKVENLFSSQIARPKEETVMTNGQRKENSYFVPLGGYDKD